MVNRFVEGRVKLYFYVKILITSPLEASRGAGVSCDCKIDWLWARYSLEEIKYLLTFIFSFFRSGVVAKRGVELCHSTRNTTRIQKVGNGVS